MMRTQSVCVMPFLHFGAEDGAMIYKNAELFNAAQLIDHEDESVSWSRLPDAVYEALESEQGKQMAHNATGVELRFVLRGEKAVIRMSTSEGEGVFHVYRGGIQGGWEDHEVHKTVRTQMEDFVIERSKNGEHLKIMSELCGTEWDCEVVRVIFDRGMFRLYDIIGDIVPPTKEQCPKKTLMAYGSSITHGSNSIDQSHSWVSVLAHNLGMDVRNLGMAGSCQMEEAVVDYIAAEGEAGRWDAALLELGINVLSWPEEKYLQRVENAVRQTALRNPNKPIFVISPFFHCGEIFDQSGKTELRRSQMEALGKRMALENVTWINGREILGNACGISADEVHPNIYGVAQIAQRLTEIIARKTGWGRRV